MSQSINLANVGATNFNGATVDKINLNGSMIWEGMVAVNIWGEHAKLEGEKTITTGYAGIRGPVIYGPGHGFDQAELPREWTEEFGTHQASSTAPSGMVRNPYYKGNKIVAAYVAATNGNASGAVRGDDSIFGGFLKITFEGVHPKDYFTSVSVNGHTYYTADTIANYVGQPLASSPVGEYSAGYNIPQLYVPTNLKSLTHWAFLLPHTGVEYFVINTYQNNVLEFR